MSNAQINIYLSIYLYIYVTTVLNMVRSFYSSKLKDLTPFKSVSI